MVKPIKDTVNIQFQKYSNERHKLAKKNTNINMRGIMKTKDGLITSMPKNSMEEYRFSLQEYRGCELIDIRVYYESSNKGMIPTRKGISVPIEQFPAFIDCLSKVGKAIKQSGRKAGENGTD